MLRVHPDDADEVKHAREHLVDMVRLGGGQLKAEVLHHGQVLEVALGLVVHFLYTRKSQS